VRSRGCFGAPPLAIQSGDSASPADAWNPVAEQSVTLPDGCLGRAAGSGCDKSRSFDLYRSLHRERSVGGNWSGNGGRRNRSDCRRRYRRHLRRIADAAGIIDRAVESARIRWPRRNTAHAGILRRRPPGRRQKSQDRDAHKCRSGGHRCAREDRNKPRVFHGSVVPCEFVHCGRNSKQDLKFQRCVVN
jgi:hypothetical protein